MFKETIALFMERAEDLESFFFFFSPLENKQNS